MRKFIIILSVLVWCTGTVHSSSLTVVRGQDFPPYHFLTDSGNPTGFIVEIITRVGQKLDLKVRFVQYPWSRCLKMVENGQADAMMNLFKTEKRMTFMYFAENELTREVNRFFKLKSYALKFDGDLNTLTGIRIGAVRNYSYGRKFDVFSPKLNILRLETETALLLNLVGRRCDLILGNEVVIRSLSAKISKGEQVIATGPGISNDPLYLGFSKARGHKELAEKFSRALKEFKASPAHEKIIKKYLDD